MSKKTISLCMIAKNEEEYLGQCLSSVKGIVDEIIVVDTGSKDSTKEIAKRFNAKVLSFKWIDDFSAARNESIKYATKDWVLVLDADEVIESSDLEKIKETVQNAEEGIAGFSLEQRSYLGNFFEGAVKNDSSFELVRDYPFYIKNSLVRLFRNKLGLYFKHKVHELIEDSIEEKNLKYKKIGIILHHFGSLKSQNINQEKAKKYSEIILKQLEDKPENPRYNYQAARMYVGRNDFANAIKHFEKAGKLNPNYKLVFSEIAKIYLKMNDKNRAIEYFKKSAKYNQDNPSPANNLAVVYMSVERFGAAKKILEEQLKKHPDSKELKYNYNECLKNMK